MLQDGILSKRELPGRALGYGQVVSGRFESIGVQVFAFWISNRMVHVWGRWLISIVFKDVCWVCDRCLGMLVDADGGFLV